MFNETAVYVLTFSRFVTGFVFAWSVTSKLRDFSVFEGAVMNFNILPGTLVKPSAVFFVSGELGVVALMLLGNRYLPVGFWLAAFLLLAFSAVLLSVLIRKLQTPCNCFGASIKPVSRYDVIRNMGLIACSLLGWFSLPNSLANQEPVEVALLGLMAVTISVAWIKLGDLVEAFL